MQLYTLHLQRDGAGIPLQDGEPLFLARQLELDLLLEPGPDSAVDKLYLVRGSDGAHSISAQDAVHLGKQGVHYLRDVAPQVLVVPVQGNGIKLIYEDDAGCHLLRLFIEAVDLPRPFAHELANQGGGLNWQHGNSGLGG
jgi:hypothetical protein